jgi:RES domain-containing protein
MACAWATALSDGERPASWFIYDRLRLQDIAGVLVPSFAPGAGIEDRNLVLWDWGPDRPHKVTVFDPSGRLPKDQLSWK